MDASRTVALAEPLQSRLIQVSESALSVTMRQPISSLHPHPFTATSPCALAVACLAVVLMSVTTLPATAFAQSVTGAAFDAETSAPLAGVLVSLVGADGERVGAVLTDEAGRFGFEVERFGRYRLRAERIGLQVTTSETFDLFSTRPHFERILMGDRAIEIAGLVVDARIKQCRLDREEGAQIQRWWQEVRTALDVSSVVQESGLAQFEVERFERRWGPDLKRVMRSDARSEVSLSDRPFVSADAEFLVEGGFVQGKLNAQREYYAPDADVLLSGVFLAGHCFSIVEHDDDALVGLSFEPTRDRDVPDITGTLWVDTTTAELQSLDFRYANLEELPENESGGYVGFEYLPSGAWIVRDWYIRMPRLGISGSRNRGRLVLVGYVDVGGRVSPISTTSVDMDRLGAVGSIRGFVYDSIRGGGLAGASVAVLGTRFQALTDSEGGFLLPRVPVGEHRVTFFHDDPAAWGLGGAFRTVEVEEGDTSQVTLALPEFKEAARIVCLGGGVDARTVLVGDLVGANEQGLANVPLEIAWDVRGVGADATTVVHETRTGSDGRFLECTLPAGVTATVRALIDDVWVDGFEVELPPYDIVYRRMMVPWVR